MLHLLAKAAAGLLALVAWAAVGAERLSIEITDQQGRGVADAVVTLMPLDGTRHATAAQAPRRVEIRQEGQQFRPRVRVVPVDTWVSFPNRDPIRHHVYSFSSAKPFEIKLFKGDEADPVHFDQPGLVAVGCNIHDWMAGYIYVTDAPYFARTGEQGMAAVDGLPAGRYRATVWHPDLNTEPSVTELVVHADDQLATTLDITPNPQTPRAGSLTARFRANVSR